MSTLFLRQTRSFHYLKQERHFYPFSALPFLTFSSEDHSVLYPNEPILRECSELICAKKGKCLLRKMATISYTFPFLSYLKLSRNSFHFHCPSQISGRSKSQGGKITFLYAVKTTGQRERIRLAVVLVLICRKDGYH